MFVEKFRRIIDNGPFFFLCFLIANATFSADTDEVKLLLVMEGDSASLNIEVQSYNQILWMFGPRETPIAQIYQQNIDMFNSNETFGDKLKIDRQTGSLTITNIRNEHSGLYKIHIFSSRGNSYRKFNITVYARLPTPLITVKTSSVQNPSSSSSSSSLVPKCVLGCSMLNVSNASISWYKGNSLFSSISVSDLNNSIYLHLECLDDSYSCVVAYSFTNQTTHINNTQHCQTCSGAVQRSHIILPSAFAVMLALVCAVLLCCHCRKYKQMGKANIQEEEMDYAEPIFCTQRLQSTDAVVEFHTVYSSIRT